MKLLTTVIESIQKLSKRKTTSKDIFNLIVGNLKIIIPDIEEDSVNYESKLCLLGASSIDRAELIEKTLEDLRISANRFDFHCANNLGELSKLIYGKLIED